MGKLKATPVRIPSDDCEVALGRKIEDSKVIDPGEPCYVHKGEWVELLPVMSLEAFLSVGSLALVISQEGRTNEEDIVAMEQASERLYRRLTQSITAWNWTDWMGDPLPQPWGNVEVFRQLTTDEILYLRGLMTQGSPSETKNDSQPSPTTSLVKGQSRRKSS